MTEHTTRKKNTNIEFATKNAVASALLHSLFIRAGDECDDDEEEK